MKTYTFKYSNWDLESYIENRNQVAQLKRREAAALVQAAEVIENEARELQRVLVPAEDFPTKSRDD